MGHDHGHHHHAHAPTNAENRKRLKLALTLTVLYMFAEVVGGLWSNSLALLADAGHMLSDAGALSLSLFALWISGRPPDPKRTYGYYRVEILAAMAQGVVLIVLAVFIVLEAYERFSAPPQVHGEVMMGVALGGLLINIIGLWILSGGKNSSLNVRGAWLHLLSDTLGSVGALISGLLIWQFGLQLADPIASLIISVLVAYSAWPLLKQTVAILMESAPGHIDVDEVRNAMASTQGVVEVHDLHIWSISEGRVCLSGHVVASQHQNDQDILRKVTELLRERFHIEHLTIQVECPRMDGERLCS